MDKLVSVVIPVFNGEQYINICLDSLIKQTYKNIELIIVNDGSTDGTNNIIKDYKRKYNFIKIIDQPNQGVSVARNNGIMHATGEYITFVDSDDYVEVDYVKHLVDIIDDYDCDVAITSYTYNDTKKESNSDVYTFDGPNAIKNMMLSIKFDSCVCSKLFKTENAKKIMFNDKLVIAEDLYFYYQLFSNCKTICYVNYVDYHYVQHKNSAINKLTIKKIESLKIFEKMLCENKDAQIHQAISSKYVSTIFHLLSLKDCEMYNKNLETYKEVVKKNRIYLLKSKYCTRKVKLACVISYLSFGAVNWLLNIRRGV